jgi:hypothetical protein
MSLAKEFENCGPQCGRNNHTYPEQNTSMLDRQGLSVSVEPVELWPVGVLAENSDSDQRDLMNFFTDCSSTSFLVIERILSKVTES